MDCRDFELDSESHQILAELSVSGWNHNQARLFRDTISNVAEKIDRKWSYTLELLVDLQKFGFVDLPGDNRLQQPRGQEGVPCRCGLVDSIRRDRIGSDADQPQTLSEQQSGGERGSGRAARPGSEGATTTRAPARRARGSRWKEPSVKVQRRREAALSKPVERLTAWDLTYLLSQRIREEALASTTADGWVRAGAISEEPTRQQIARWIREDGVEPAVVREMIEIFVADQQLLEQPTPAWRTFISQRSRLEFDARRRLGDYSADRRSVPSGETLPTWADIQRRQQRAANPEN